MRKLILVVHTSLDGYVAGLQGELDNFPGGEESLEAVCRLTDDADAALFGRVSYELLNNYWPQRKDNPEATKNEIDFSNWYNSAAKIMLSNTIQLGALPGATIISNNIAHEIIKIKQQPGKSILIFGSPATAQLLMQLDLIDNYRIYINSVIFGEGIPLFSGVTNYKKLKLIDAAQIPNGEIALNYTVDRS